MARLRTGAVAAGLYVLLAGTTIAQETPTVDEIVARHVEAKGGEEALAGLRSYRAKGVYTAFSEPEPFALWRARPDSYRFETVLLEEPDLEAYDGEAGWTRSPIVGTDWPLRMTDPHVTAVTAIADFDGSLIGWREDGHEVTLAGRVDYDGIDAWKLDVKRAEGFEETWYLDAESYLEVAWEGPMQDFGSPVPGKSYFEDHRPVAGVLLPHVIESEYLIRHRRMEIQEIVANPKIPTDWFSLPPIEPMEALAGMAGDWQVTVEARPPFARAPWSEAGTTTSTVTEEAAGALLAEKLSLDLQGRTVQVMRTLSWDRFAETYRLTHFDDYTSHTNVFHGSTEEGRLTLSNADTGTATVVSDEPQIERWAIYDVGAEGFTVEQETTTDGGETWVGVLRLTYRRAADGKKAG